MSHSRPSRRDFFAWTGAASSLLVAPLSAAGARARQAASGWVDGGRPDVRRLPDGLQAMLLHGEAGRAITGRVVRIDAEARREVAHGLCLGRDALGVGGPRSRVEAALACKKWLRRHPDAHTLVVRVDRADDIRTALDLTAGRAHVFLLGATEAAQATDAIAKAGATVLLGPSVWEGASSARAVERAEAAVAMVRQDVPFVWATGGHAELPEVAAGAMARGLSAEEALAVLEGRALGVRSHATGCGHARSMPATSPDALHCSSQEPGPTAPA